MSENAWRRDSDMIFTQISTSGLENFEEANRLICMLYIPDMTINRAGISHALSRLEKFYKQQPPACAKP